MFANLVCHKFRKKWTNHRSWRNENILFHERMGTRWPARWRRRLASKPTHWRKRSSIWMFSLLVYLQGKLRYFHFTSTARHKKIFTFLIFFFSWQNWFQGFDELSIKGQNEMGSAKTFWKITKHDVHSIPEGRWLEGQVEVRSQDGDNYWVRFAMQ